MNDVTTPTKLFHGSSRTPSMKSSPWNQHRKVKPSPTKRGVVAEMEGDSSYGLNSSRIMLEITSSAHDSFQYVARDESGMEIATIVLKNDETGVCGKVLNGPKQVFARWNTTRGDRARRTRLLGAGGSIGSVINNRKLVLDDDDGHSGFGPIYSCIPMSSLGENSKACHSMSCVVHYKQVGHSGKPAKGSFQHWEDNKVQRVELYVPDDASAERRLGLFIYVAYQIGKFNFDVQNNDAEKENAAFMANADGC